jgi:hypothetical protein
MPTNKANFGIGDGSGSGYFGYGTAGSAASVSANILISQDGITATFPTHDVLKDWASKVIRSMPGEDLPTVQANFITTSSDVFTLLFEGTTIDPNTTPTPRSFIFQMVDGDDVITYSTLNGVVTEVSDVTFAPNEVITWTATITAESWTISKTTES